MRLYIVDVFAEQQLAGNQLAVVRDAAHLSTEQMQAIALEMNYSETTFVTEEQAGRAKVRIFTPAWELPFAGHPTLGTAWVLADGRGEFTLELAAGDVGVSFTQDGLGWMVPPEVMLGPSFDRAPELVGLTSDDLHPDYPVQLAEVGPKFVLIGLRNLDALRRATLNDALHAELTGAGVGVNCVFLFTDEAYSPESDFAARMYFRSAGVREDPATGSANTAFSAYLRALSAAERRVIVDQGVEMNRPSRLYLDVGEQIRVGGRVQAVVRGELELA